jgi:hypothetical protein
MTSRKTSSELLLIGLAAFIFLLAALGLFLLQDPQAPLPWAVTATSSPTQPATATQPIAIGVNLPTSTPRTSYTPFATRLTIVAPTPTPTPGSSPTPDASAAASQTPGPTPTGTITPATPTPTFVPGTQAPTATNTMTPIPAVSPTLAPGQLGISGRVVRNGAPVAGVSVSFRDDQPPRSFITDSQGRYWFTTYAIGIDFLLSFEQSANPQYTSATPIASTALLYGYLPSGSTVITLPDLEISLVLNGQSFEPTTPLDGATFNAANITSANPIQFVWTTYNQAEYYYVELSPSASDEILWGSENTTSTNAMFNGSLDDDTQISAGTYRWFVAANRAINDYYLVIYTQPRSLVINP